MKHRIATQCSLVNVVARQIVVYALIAMGLQIAVVFGNYYYDNPELARLIVNSEASRLVSGSSSDTGGIRYELPDTMARYGAPGTAYLARIRTTSGTILFSNCDPSCSRRLPPSEFNPPDFWLRQIEPGKPISVAGGRTFDVGDERVLVELAILGDPAGVIWSVIGHEVLDHMAMPMALMLVFVLGATPLAVRRALRPVAVAASQASRIDPLNEASQLDVTGMPSEVAHLGAAINRSIGRIGELIRSQKVFTAALSHEILTPLAIMRLQLAHIRDPRARRLETDLQGLTHFVNQLTSLARLETVDLSTMQRVDPVLLSRSVVTAIAPWVYEAGCGIGFSDRGGTPLLASSSLVEDALRNLIENAVRHTGPGTQITVEVGPGRRLAVVDDAGAYSGATSGTTAGSGMVMQAGGVGFGLEIVRRIASVHAARFEIEAVCGQRTSASLVFSAAA